ncbi:MAG TPA: 1-deoxy-D-xylulose-5-phosphate synthase [Dehalococcoidales bacterium]|nr:1-deoxy-D-xylulose-5-phosphate synthase [Dehalococcoidales bacterium]
MTRLLDSINQPGDLKNLTEEQLIQLAAEIRDELVAVVSANGGHLASNLGVVELTIALHRIFDSPRDKIVWDVGHQSYAHKLLTGRREKFNTLRQYGGLSGFTCRNESEHDPFGAGHASTSISAALGMAVARDLSKEDYQVVAVIGDGAISGGMALEGANQAGHLNSRLIVILNDNGMSISPTVGAYARVLDKLRYDHRYRIGREKSRRFITRMPSGNWVWRQALRIERTFKYMFKPSALWEDLGFSYMGPIDGHNIAEIEKALKRAREYKAGPILIHVVTTKGKGYQPAEGDAVYFHGIAAKNGAKKSVPTYSDVFARTVLKLARQDPKIMVITPAMPEGNSLSAVQSELPLRVIDVGICEQHAVTFAAGLATQGLIPIVAIYSTFLQRSFDQIIHDVCLQELPVVFAVDRGGIVGDDGKTHQGTFDLSYLTLIPNLIVAAPKDENELQHLLYTAVKAGKPMAVRYPRSAGLGVKLDEELHPINIGESETLRAGGDAAIFAIGSMVAPAEQAAAELEKQGISVTVVNARFVKPLDNALAEIAARTKNIVTVEENTLKGGFGSEVAALLQKSGLNDVGMINLGLPDKFIEHGPQSFLRSKYGLDADGIKKAVLTFFSVMEAKK